MTSWDQLQCHFVLEGRVGEATWAAYSSSHIWRGPAKHRAYRMQTCAWMIRVLFGANNNNFHWCFHPDGYCITSRRRFCKVLHSTQGVNMAEILRLQTKNPKKLVCLPEASQPVVLKIYGSLFGSSLVLVPRYTEKGFLDERDTHGHPIFSW